MALGAFGLLLYARTFQYIGCPEAGSYVWRNYGYLHAAAGMEGHTDLFLQAIRFLGLSS